MQAFYELDQATQAIVERAQRAGRDVLDKEAASVDKEGRFPRNSIRALGDAGLLGLSLPKKWGGMEQGPRAFAAVAETLARSCPSTAMVYVMHVCAANVVAQAPSPPEKLLTTLAFSESGSRSHFWAPVSREAGKNGTRSLSAEKSFVTSAGEADSYVTSTLAENGKTPVESSLWLV